MQAEMAVKPKLVYENKFIDFKGLGDADIQDAIDEYIVNSNEIRKENKRLKKLIDELMNENKILKNIKDKNELEIDNLFKAGQKYKEHYEYWFDKYNSN